MESPGRTERKDTTINVRLPARTRDLIDSAATVSGKTRTEFILESARRSAEEVLLDQAVFGLGAKDYAGFLAALDMPNPPNDRLKSLLAAKAPWEAWSSPRRFLSASSTTSHVSTAANLR